MLRKFAPALMALAGYVGRTDGTLALQRVELYFQSLFNAFASVDSAPLSEPITYHLRHGRDPEGAPSRSGSLAPKFTLEGLRSHTHDVLGRRVPRRRIPQRVNRE